MKTIPQPRSHRLANASGLPGRVLAVDYGRQRIGLAISDELRLTAQPLTILLRTNRANDLRRLREICREHGVTAIIVGHPLHLSGTRSEMADEACRFATRLKKNLGLAVELVDERLTSWEAAQIRRPPDSTSARPRPIDDLAAALILRDFLEKEREERSSQRVKEAC